ncbi:hypothetical protein [Euzebya tangerina]|uniref:hypothetical protein n=1 Tax=Euzebya tangerina TaxID=591198 RepID=UPI0039C8B109
MRCGGPCPGGWADVTDTPAQVAEREVGEETGLWYVHHDCSRCSIVTGTTIHPGPTASIQGILRVRTNRRRVASRDPRNGQPHVLGTRQPAR